MKTTKMVFVATVIGLGQYFDVMAIWVDGEQPGCCGGYSGWLRTNMVAFVSDGLGLGHKGFDGYRGMLRSTRVLWW